DNEIELIKSRSTMFKVASELHLNVNYSIAGRVKSTQIYSNKPFEFLIADFIDAYYSCKVNILGPDNYELIEGNGKVIHGKWDDTISLTSRKVVLKKTAAFTPDKTQYTINVIPMHVAAGRYNVDINSPGKSASFIALSMLDPIPERSVDIINKLMEVYAKSNVQSRNRISDSTMSFIDRRIDIVNAELSSIELSIDTFKQKHGIANMSAQSEQLVDANTTALQNLGNQEVELYEIDAISGYMNKKNDDKAIVLPASLLNNAGLAELKNKFNSLQFEIENSLIANTAENPVTQTLIKQRNEIKQNIVASLASSRIALQLQVDKTKKELAKISSNIRDVPKVERLALEYTRMQAIKQDLYIFLLKKREETAIEKAATVPDANPIDPAITIGIVSPNRSRVLMLSFLFGTIIPFGIIMLRRALNIRIINKSDILKLTTIPIIGEIGNNTDNEDSIAVRKNSRTVIAEQFRALRTNLQYFLTNKNDKVLMITSSMSGEGKSFIATNLSITLAMSGMKVVLVELDLRKPKISKTLNIENNIGFSNYAIGKAEFSDIIIPSGIEPNLFIVPSGPIPPNPSELILLHRTEELFSYLRANFDYVILDTSPVGLVTDAQLLNRYADTTLYIVRQGRTYKQQLDIPNELYYNGKIPRLSLIINDVVANRGFAYGYGYEETYGYGYGYGSGGYGYGSYGTGYYIDNKKKGISSWFRFRKK
ncbi:MAG: polysaccharide biosynthesis tyrosine autokinase, partial [Chitinophagales bacterium]